MKLGGPHARYQGGQNRPRCCAVSATVKDKPTSGPLAARLRCRRSGKLSGTAMRRLEIANLRRIDDAVCVLVGSFGAWTLREHAAAWARQPVLHRFDFGHSRAMLGGRARARRL